MQKKARHNVSSSIEPSIVSPIISSEAKHTPIQDKESKDTLKLSSISNDNSKLAASYMSTATEKSVRPKVYMSPKKAAQNQLFKNKPVRFSAIPIHTEEKTADVIASKPTPAVQKPMPSFSSSKSQNETADELTPVEAPVSKSSQRTGLFFDIKFAFGLIAIVVAVNLLLAMLVDSKDKTQPTHIANVAPKAVITPVIPKSEPVQAQGALVTNPLSDVEPAAGNPLPANPAPLPVPAAVVKPVEPNLGVVTNAADEKQPKRNLLSIIDQY